MGSLWPLTRQDLKKFGIRGLSKSSDTPREEDKYITLEDRHTSNNLPIRYLEYDALYNHADELMVLYNTAPYETYYGLDDGGWRSTLPTRQWCEIIEELHQEELFDNNGVDLGKLSWRAVVPLYNLGFPLKQIDKMVDFGLGITERVFDHHMEKAADIIEYYEKVKAHREYHKAQPASPDSYHIKAQSGDIEHIADLLEKGKFIVLCRSLQIY